MRSRLLYTAATIGRSSGRAVSFSTIDASVTACRIVRLRAAAAWRSSGVNTCSNLSAIRRTSFAASVWRGSA